MKKNMAMAVIVVFFLLEIIIISPSMTAVKTIYVDDDGIADYTHIQDAINAANENDIVYVYNGTYNEHILLNKAIQLIGENANSTIIKSLEKKDIIQVLNTEMVTISDFTIQNDIEFQEYLAGIYLKNSTDVVIEHNSISGCFDAILLKSSYCVISHNILDKNKIGISFGHYRDSYIDKFTTTYLDNILSHEYNIIIKNSITNNSETGISISYSSENKITENCIFHNTFGIKLQQSSNNKISQNDFIENTINAFAFDVCANMWNNNYWDNWIGLHLSILSMMPYYIPGTLFSNIDWNPAENPHIPLKK
jgi:nitrous oxidase accessory protein